MPKPSTIVMKTGPDRRAPHRAELAKCQRDGVERGGTGVGAMSIAEINEEPGSPEIGIGDPLAVLIDEVERTADRAINHELHTAIPLPASAENLQEDFYPRFNKHH